MTDSTEKETLQLVTNMSPSKITQYFEAKKSRRRGAVKAEKSKEAVIEAGSVYLTPESSPGNTIKEGMGKDPEITPGLLHSVTGTDGSTTHSQQNGIVSDPPRVRQKSNPSSAGKTASEVGGSIENSNPARCISSLVDDLDLQVNPIQDVPSTKPIASPTKSKKDNVSAFSGDSSVASPSIPRSKLRKSAKSGQSMASAGSEPVKPKPGRRKKNVVAQVNTITDYFPVRRSSRQTKSEIEKEKHSLLEKLILSKCEDGLKIQDFDNKGRGVVATKNFDKGDFVVEYAGDLLDIPTAREKELEYGKNPEIGCYMYFFKCGEKQYCVDATAESDRLGRLLNHTREGNCCTRALMVEGIPRLILVAQRDIKAGEELSYDYGDRSKAALEAHPWLKS
ncbi:N-lysine methyltransferase KMT5A [Aplysia californica]|uniref:[histone H4]-lysine(20) N-methyltransferase n=1 Tax=Aplysia californica TaxID=6500 RepID=A0ABM0JWU7_APLCA|nr:N-lysine methyltransferase KMT5A [Aplysia californica]